MPHWTAWIYGPMIIVAIAFVLTRYVFPAVIRGDGEHGAAPPTGTRLAPPPTGTVLASARGCSGRISWVRFNHTLEVRVFADRFVLRPTFMGDHTVMANEIVSVSGTRTKLTVEHAASVVRSPVILWLGRRNEVRLAIEALPVNHPRPTG